MKVDIHLPVKSRKVRLPPGLDGVEEGFTGWVILRSSNLAACRYSKESRSLDIAFRSGDVYRYTHVPETVYTGLVRAGSAGKFHHSSIRNIFSATKIAGNEGLS